MITFFYTVFAFEESQNDSLLLKKNAMSTILSFESRHF